MLISRRACLIFWIVATVVASSACHDPDKFSLQGPSSPNGALPSSLLDVVPQTTSIPATGGARTRIEARIDPASTVRTVTFETTAGTLFAGSGTSARTPVLEVPIDTSGVAVAELQSATQPGTARVTVKVAIPGTNPQQHFSRSVDITFAPVNTGEMITLTATPQSAEADGATLIRLVATIGADIPAGSRTVTFTTTGGRFVTNTANADERTATVVADNSHTASVDLVAPLVAGPVAVTATVSTFSARTTIAFSRAGPDVVFVELDQGSVMRAGNDVARVTVTLLRDVGQVSDNTIVSFEARDSAGTRIGSFEKVTLARIEDTDTSTFKRVVATADFNPDDTAAAGVATITATVGSRSGSATITLN